MDDDIMRWHKRFAADCYNRAWDLMDLAERTAEQDAELLAAAFAQRFHWYQAGDDANKAIADWQVARAASFTGDAEVAVRFAERAVARAEHVSQPDFLRASCYEGLARAHAAAGDAAARDRWVERARDALGSITQDDDRTEIARQIDSVPRA